MDDGWVVEHSKTIDYQGAVEGDYALATITRVLARYINGYSRQHRVTVTVERPSSEADAALDNQPPEPEFRVGESDQQGLGGASTTELRGRRAGNSDKYLRAFPGRAVEVGVQREGVDGSEGGREGEGEGDDGGVGWLNPPLVPEWVTDQLANDSFDEPEYTFTDTELRLAIDLYLRNLPYSMWSEWEVKKDERRKLAAEWLYRQFREVIAVAKGENNGSDHPYPSDS